MDVIPDEQAAGHNGPTRLVSYARVNVAFDEESPVVKYARRESLLSEKSSQASEKFCPPSEKTGNFRAIPVSGGVVRVRGAYKRYGRSGPFVLNNFAMTMEKGTIYSLLGSSGCGKTTALTCILGMRNLDKGTISVFGKHPGSDGSEVPGIRVGYMPQEIALHHQFTIDETLRYYAALFGMSNSEMREAREYIMSFLDLHDESRRVQDLSSGQQRRVSLAVALIHSPELVILDEPTVGVDALLREKIWEHLTWLVKEQGTSVIITTHYIEEARHSNMIGIMRGGRLLAENDPDTLLAHYNATLLEDVVLRLCRSDEEVPSGKEKSLPNGNGHYKALEKKPEPIAEEDDNSSTKEKPSSRRGSEAWSRRSSVYNNVEVERKQGYLRSLVRIRGLILKNIFVMWRNIFLVLFMIMTPSFMVLLICNGIGNEPRPLTLGVVNHESNFSNCLEYATWREADFGSGSGNGSGEEEVDLEEGCDLDFLSCKFLARIPDDVILKEYVSESEATKGVKAGVIWGYISIPEGYSDHVYARTATGNRVDEEALDGSFITYQLDMTSKMVTGFIKKTLGDSFEEFIKIMLKNCGINEKLGDRPVRALEPIYGSDDTDLREFIAPSLLVGFLFFFPLCSSSVQFVYDRKQGTLLRARVAGVSTSEIMISYFVTDGVVLIVQLALSLAIIIVLFGFQVRGSLPLLVLQYFLMGLGGVSAGFLLASICTEEVEAVLLAMASFFPNFLLSGLLWPIEGMPYWMQYMTYVLPATFPGETVRSILSRGWGLTHIRVWPGFAASIIWLFAYWGATLAIHKIVLSRK